MKIDIGCGPNKKGPDWIGVDRVKFPNVDVVCDLAARNDVMIVGAPPPLPFKPWPFESNSVDEVHCSHFVEHLEARERVHFANELFRILKPGAKALIITPHWSSNRAYGDMTHKWPPVSEMWAYYLKREWRKANAPHDDIEWSPDGYSCDFEVGWGYSLRQDVTVRNQEYQAYAMTNYKDVCQDWIATLTKPI